LFDLGSVLIGDVSCRSAFGVSVASVFLGKYLVVD
jgi:hypothetical protein